ncbi:SMC-Scp complex subunit ScpB [Corynebacterium pygosceleis]|uniref:SMC-Scp complex subunit ScpB n=1 Tax=Corynebacterium pygosceleis TaxID=2800406 RepID=A0A9Q4C9E6_9CORY|nr:SMC-Scp complex subunit ScpB [Corynebacterium pygosceleis]MCK7637126.1 SMC-Scp complex subunit ScpB [Corynebacterium pygosceleis]MCK7674600.1 SMC-Scp complex subunit ScpB [Corynebacterium pygosceleis]MCL0120098.1 SMC-Scp complex subunit ScpB [Corynebacterium pygosceleis]MCX7443646.1 SMC-Scp complex subunit ScpB [Corynebacterium pygosceleis]MCX7467880.1 SMC-Scp complex subunit ScpB [Corynebacterium pygosceleis]
MSETGFHKPAPVTALRSQIESILLVVDTPVAVETLATVLGAEVDLVTRVLEEIRGEFDARGNGFDLRAGAEGWRLYTRPENAGVVEKLILDGSQSRLSRAALETLAVVAYRQPVTRAQVSAVRGVNVDGVMRTLQLRGLIREAETDQATGAHRYVTTELLLELLGIDSLERLPDLAPLLPDVDSIDEDY